MFKSLLYLAILTTVVVASWIGFSVYHNHTTSTISSDTSIRIAPIQPEFDRETIQSIKSKKNVGANLNEQRANVTLAPEVNPTPTSTSSGEINL